MKLHKIIVVAFLGLGLSMPLMAADTISQELIKSAKKWDVKGISPAKLKKMIDDEADLWMLDVRDPYMRVEGSIEGLDNAAVARGNLEFKIEEEIEDKKAFIVVYCRSGKLAVLAAQTLVKTMGYKNVVYLEGGLDNWLESGYSVFNHLGELKLVKE